MNRAGQALTGYTPDELLRKSQADLVHPEDLLSASAYRELLSTNGNSPARYECRIRRKDGSLRWVEIAASRIDFEGAPALLGTALDISERKRSEQAIRYGEQLFRSVVESSADIVTILDDSGTVRYASPAVTRQLCWTPEELIGQNGFALVHPEDRELAAEAIRLGIEDYRKNPPVEVRVRHADGTYRLYEAASSHYFEGGARVGLVCSFRAISDRKQAETDLRESERKFRLLFERNVAGVYVSRLDGRILDCNDAAARVFGYEDRHELLHQDAAMLYDNPRERSRFVDAILSKGFLNDYEAQYRKKDGSAVWLLENVTLFEPEPGAEKLIQGTLVDITGRKRAEQLQAALYQIASLTSSPDDSREYYKHLHMILKELMYAENMYVALLDSERTDLRFRYFCDEREPNPVRRPLAKGLSEYVIRTGEPILADVEVTRMLEANGEIELLGPDSLEWMGAPLRANGETVGVIALQSYAPEHTYTRSDLEVLNFVAQQISAAVERESIENALRESEERYRSLIYSAVHGIYRASIAEDRFLEVNPALVEMLGYNSADELKQLKLSTDLYAEPEERAQLVADCMLHPRIEGREAHWKKRSGDLITVRLSGRVIHNEKQRPEALEVIVEDVTERRQLEARLRQRQKMEAVGQLASGIAHEFNNLLTVIKGYSELLLAQARADEQGPLGEIVKAASKAGELTRQLHTFSKSQAHTPEWFDLNSILTSMSPLLERMLKNSARLNLDLSPGVGSVYADPVSIEHVILNLVLNARDAVQPGGEVWIQTVRVEADDPALASAPSSSREYARLTVSDNGSGIPAELKDRVFEPFFTTKEVGKGAGLGLSTVYATAQAAGGFVSLDSAPETGTRISLFLPCYRAEFTGLRSSPTILLVEDQDPLRELIAEVLRSNGLEVIAVGNCQDAIEAFTQKPEFDLLLTDINLGEMKGTELALQLTAKAPHLAVLFTSGTAPESELQRGAQFLPKPFTAEKLLAKVNELLKA